MLLTRAVSASAAHVAMHFVQRSETIAVSVMRFLPETRVSIQISLADPVWLREQAGEWRVVPRIALWTPRYRWCYGYIQQQVQVYAVSLSPLWTSALMAGRAGPRINTCVALTELDPVLAEQLLPLSGERFEPWTERAERSLLQAAGRVGLGDHPLKAAETILATDEGAAVAQAALACQLSERQFRRRFTDIYGVTPKHYQRAIRVDRMLKLLHENPWEADPWRASPIAFADQAHAIREFRSMTGMTPGDYAKAKRQGDATLRSVAAPGLVGPAEYGSCIEP